MTLADGIWHQIFSFDNYGELLALVRNSLIAGAALGLVGAALGLVGGLVGVFVIMRDLPFAVHGISELSFAGASAALLLEVNIAAGSIVGSLVAAGTIGVLGARARDRNSVIGILMPFGLGLGVLFLALYKGRAANKFGLLTGQIVAVDTPQMNWLLGTSALILVALAVLWRPLAFANAAGYAMDFHAHRAQRQPLARTVAVGRDGDSWRWCPDEEYWPITRPRGPVS